MLSRGENGLRVSLRAGQERGHNLHGGSREPWEPWEAPARLSEPLPSPCLQLSCWRSPWPSSHPVPCSQLTAPTNRTQVLSSMPTSGLLIRIEKNKKFIPGYLQIASTLECSQTAILYQQLLRKKISCKSSYLRQSCISHPHGFP